ncbi:MAG TPA: endonuclease/exonuclease/phosphatase family protein [Roseateles sp.]
MKLRLTTFNCENLFGRYAFLDKPPTDQPKDYIQDIKVTDVVAFEPGRSNTLKPRPIAEAQRKNTGLAILDAAPDILAVCEVENLTALRLFNAKYLGNYFDRILLVEGNDPRGIDVGMLLRRGLKVDVRAIRSHADDAALGGFLTTTNMLDMKGRVGKASFSRDCLEVDIDAGNAALTLLVNHFKAQETTSGGADPTTAKRRGQAERAAAIAKRARAAGRLPIVMGDLNKDVASPQYDDSINPVARSSVFVDPVRALPADQRWTHYFSSKRSVSQLDYLLPDKGLAGAIAGVQISRGGLSPKCKQYTGPRLGSIATDGQEASDHCPLSVDFVL